MKQIVCDVCGTTDETGEDWAELLLPPSWIEENMDPETGIRIDVCSKECLIAPFRPQATQNYEEELKEDFQEEERSVTIPKGHLYPTEEQIEQATGVKRRM